MHFLRVTFIIGSSNRLFFPFGPGPSDKVLAVLPDSSGGMLSSEPQSGLSTGRTLNRREGLHRYQRPPHGSAAHDAVLVLDPSPEENFGHPVVLFYVDVNVTKKRCSHLDGIYLGEWTHPSEPLLVLNQRFRHKSLLRLSDSSESNRKAAQICPNISWSCWKFQSFKHILYFWSGIHFLILKFRSNLIH